MIESSKTVKPQAALILKFPPLFLSRPDLLRMKCQKVNKDQTESGQRCILHMLLWDCECVCVCVEMLPAAPSDRTSYLPQREGLFSGQTPLKLNDRKSSFRQTDSTTVLPSPNTHTHAGKRKRGCALVCLPAIMGMCYCLKHRHFPLSVRWFPLRDTEREICTVFLSFCHYSTICCYYGHINYSPGGNA